MNETSRVKVKDDLHIIPEFKKEPEHQSTTTCWCKPTLRELLSGERFWIHHRPK